MDAYDLVVIGAGPAGSMAARVAAHHGFKTLVLEQRRIVGYPSHCAGGILSLILDKMKLIPIVHSSIYTLIENIDIHSPGGRRAVHSFGKPIGYIVHRPHFDQLLMEDAQRRGTELRTGTRAIGLERDHRIFHEVVIKSRNGIQRIKTKLIIGADGIAANVAKWAGLSVSRQYLGSGYGYNADYVKNLSRNTVEIYFLNALPGGYAWIFPQGPETANVGVGGYNNGTYMQKVFEWFRTRHPVASSKLHAARLTDFTGGIVPGSKVPRSTTFNYGLIVGDAANQVDYLSGEGIRLALVCGDLAGRVATAALQEEDLSLIHSYHRLMQQTLWLELFASYLIRHFLLHFKASDYDNFVQALSKTNLDLIFDKRKWVPLFLQGLLKSPSLISVVRYVLKSFPPQVKQNFFP
ncbi:MAG: NAD(P)/FAD-dependent oxidoreductase [Candidatus Helarchaeota archaeon]|nr:NAD(P)/FAD-dependent oxidoreductase [Candidatus Helarchaeota archaeon]